MVQWRGQVREEQAAGWRPYAKRHPRRGAIVLELGMLRLRRRTATRAQTLGDAPCEHGHSDDGAEAGEESRSWGEHRWRRQLRQTRPRRHRTVLRRQRAPQSGPAHLVKHWLLQVELIGSDCYSVRFNAICPEFLQAT